MRSAASRPTRQSTTRSAPDNAASTTRPTSSSVRTTPAHSRPGAPCQPVSAGRSNSAIACRAGRADVAPSMTTNRGTPQPCTNDAACTREDAPSFVDADSTRVTTVLRPMPSLAAIWALDRPCPTNWSTSRSRPVRPLGSLVRAAVRRMPELTQRTPDTGQHHRVPVRLGRRLHRLEDGRGPGLIAGQPRRLTLRPTAAQLSPPVIRRPGRSGPGEQRGRSGRIDGEQRHRSRLERNGGQDRFGLLRGRLARRRGPIRGGPRPGSPGRTPG